MSSGFFQGDFCQSEASKTDPMTCKRMIFCSGQAGHGMGTAGFPGMGVLQWLDGFMENPIHKWMMTRGTPIYQETSTLAQYGSIMGEGLMNRLEQKPERLTGRSSTICEALAIAEV